MKIRVEYGDNGGRGSKDVYKCTTFTCDKLESVYWGEKKLFIEKWLEEQNVDDKEEIKEITSYVEEFSECNEKYFYVGVEEGEYVEGYVLA